MHQCNGLQPLKRYMLNYFIWCSLLTVDCLVVEWRNSEIMHLASYTKFYPYTLASVTFIATFIFVHAK